MINVGILIIATNRYYDYVDPLLQSVKKYFLVVPGYNIQPFVFTNQSSSATQGAIQFSIKHLPWPMMTLLRYRIFIEHRQYLEKMDYLYYCDADMRLVGEVGKEILGTTVGTIHPLFYDKPREMLVGYEGRPESRAYISIGKGKRYYAGGFLGGVSKDFLSLATVIADSIDDDLERGVIAKWHDESHLNRYYADNPPSIELSPSYCYPEDMSLPFEKKIICLKKKHVHMRAELSLFSQAIRLFKQKIIRR